MNRRNFLRGLLGAGVVAAAPPIIHVLAPPGGWQLSNGVWATNGHGNAGWINKTPEEILADFNAALGINTHLNYSDFYDFSASRVIIRFHGPQYASAIAVVGV